MADKKISQLTNITGANLADDDEFVVVDTSVDETKAITYGELRGVVTPADLTLDSLDLAAIAESKGVTAVDVFVYDTSKDSDGGAWRKRTQGTSWYNETLNTATRGARREFPAVAVIVATTGSVTIYDGDDPSLPMWMVFNVGVNNLVSSGEPTSLAALEGLLIVGKASNNGLAKINMINDNGSVQSTAGFFEYKSVVSARNDTSGFSAASGDGIVNSTVNDVAMTVLPDAPIDAATGLPVPTIAVATEGGVSVIKDDGNVWDITHSSYSVVSKVSLNSYGGISYFTDNSLNGRYHHVDYALPDADVVKGVGYSGANSSEFYHTIPAATYTNETGKYSVFNGGGGIVDAGDELIVGGASGASGGVAKVFRNPSASSTGLISEIKSTYNTGWMPGDIKGAFLSSTDTASLVGSGELLTNGDFATNDLTGWSNTSTGTGTVSAATGAAAFSGNDASNRGIISQQLTLIAGQTYVLSFDRSAYTSGSMSFGWGATSAFSGLTTFASVSGTGSHDVTFTAPSGSLYLFFWTNSGGFVGSIDNISVKLADADRSVNNNGLVVSGSITRSPVATGADLVAYSGFSTSNYLEQPYNSDLDFGTGDFCVMGWVKPASVGADYIFDCRDQTVTPTGFFIYINGSGQPTLYTQSVGSSTLATSSQALRVGSWQYVVGVRRGGINYIYINGVLTGTASGATQNVNHTNRRLVVGNSIGLFSYHALQSSLALLRISATAPSADQIKKIYEDEKVLFQENAAATLYGTSDAVTALAHDPDTDLLHVGTSAGRSVFQGLRRVSNTTTAVGTAISASNGLVVEE